MSASRAASRLLVVAALVTVLAACSQSSNSGGQTKLGSPATVTTPASSATTSSTSTVAPATTAPKLVGQPTPDAAAQRLYDAWKANDKTTAATVATPDALAGMWATAPGDYALYNHCDSGEFGTSGCLFRAPATYATIQFNMERRGATWVVLDAVYMPK